MITLVMAAYLLMIPDPMEHVNTQLRRGDLRLALYELESVLNWDPENLDAMWVKARILSQWGAWQESDTLYAHILHRDPWDDEARKQRIDVLWRMGHTAEALTVTHQLLQRHPQDADGLRWKKKIQSDEKPKGHKAWSPVLRGSVGMFYDSNAIFASGPDLTVSDTQAGVGIGNFEAGAQHNGRRHIFSMISRGTLRASVAGSKDAMDTLGSNAGATMMYQHDIKKYRLGFDARYDEWFTHMFTKPKQRTISPSITFGVPISNKHRLQLLIGSDIAFVPHVSGFTDNASIKSVLRDDIVLRGLWITLDIGGFMNFVYGKQHDIINLLGNYGEAWSAITVSYRLMHQLDAIGAISGSVRGYNSGGHEQAYRLLSGLRMFVQKNIELQLEYSFGQRFAEAPRHYMRHEVGLTARFWYN